MAMIRCNSPVMTVLDKPSETRRKAGTLVHLAENAEPRPVWFIFVQVVGFHANDRYVPC